MPLTAYCSNCVRTRNRWFVLLSRIPRISRTESRRTGGWPSPAQFVADQTRLHLDSAARKRERWLRNSPEIDSRFDVSADKISASAAKPIGRGGDKEMARTIAISVFSPLSLSPLLPLTSESSRRTSNPSPLKNGKLFRDSS